DWRSPSRRAACVKLSVYATDRKVRRWVGSYMPGSLLRSSRSTITVRAVYGIPDHGTEEQDGAGTPCPHEAGIPLSPPPRGTRTGGPHRLAHTPKLLEHRESPALAALDADRPVHHAPARHGGR